MKLAAFILGLTTAFFAYAERIDGPANIRDGINGKLLFSLEDNVQVECEKAIDGWHIIGIVVKAPENMEQWYLPKNFELYSFDGQYLGKTLSEVEFNEMDEDNYAVLNGYTHKTNIKGSSRIETNIENIISSSQSVNFSDFKKHIEQFEYQQDDQFSWGKTYIYYETWVSDPSPGARIRLIFEEDTLVGIIHTRQIEVPGYRDYDILWGTSLLTNLKMGNPKIDKIVHDYRNFLQSVD